MSRRLTIWDFDDTLALSSEAVGLLREHNPDVPDEQWWSDPNVSTMAAQQTKPNVPLWETVRDTPGDHVIVTGRHSAAVLAWLGWHADDDSIRPGLVKITDVESVLGDGWPVDGVAARKAMYVREKRKQYDEVHLFDDHPDVCRAAMMAGAQVHQVVDGGVQPGNWTIQRRPAWIYPAT